MKPVQYLTADYLRECQKLSGEEIVTFLENFRLLHESSKDKTQLISLKVPQSLLQAFKIQAQLQGVRYQTQIKNLMRQWLVEGQ